MSRSTIRSSGASSPIDLELDLADGRGDHRAEVGHARRPDGLAQPDRALERRRLEDLGVGDRDADADARPLADLGRSPGEVGQLGDELLHEAGHDDDGQAVLDREAVLLLADDRHLVVERPRIVGPDLRPEPVLERGDDPAARGVVLGVGRGDHVQVERQPDDEAADLDVALLEDVEQADLDPLGQVGQLVDRDDPAVGARDQAVVEGQLVGQVAALGDLDRVDLADEVGDGDVGRGELLGVAPVARQPVDRRRLAVALDDGAGRRADGRQRVVVELATADDRQPRVEQADQQPRHPGLGLAALAEEDEVVTGQDRVLDRRDDRLLVADDAREDLRPDGQPLEEVGAKLLLDGPRAPTRCAKVGQGRRGGLVLGDGIHDALPWCRAGPRA